jgi:hypothetical protein
MTAHCSSVGEEHSNVTDTANFLALKQHPRPNWRAPLAPGQTPRRQLGGVAKQRRPKHDGSQSCERRECSRRPRRGPAPVLLVVGAPRETLMIMEIRVHLFNAADQASTVTLAKEAWMVPWENRLQECQKSKRRSSERIGSRGAKPRCRDSR